MAGGRPTKLTEELAEELCKLLSEGKPIKPSCELVGIDVSTFNKWRALAKRGDERYSEFFAMVARARAEGELHLLGIATSGDGPGTSNGPAKCAQWVLERSFGARYQPRVNVKVEEGLALLMADVERVCGGKNCGCYEEILTAIAAREDGEGAPSGDTGAEEPALH